MKWFVATLVALTPLGALAQNPGVSTASTCKALAVSSTPGVIDSANRVRPPTFAAGKTQDLFFTLVLQKPISLFELKLFTPKGFLYQTITVPVAAEGEVEAQGTTTSVPGVPFPLRVHKASAVALGAGKYLGVTAPPLFLGGTAITDHSLYGTWRAEVWLPGIASGTKAAGPAKKALPCATQLFEITP